MANERYKPSIETRVAAALKANGEADRNTLAELHNEAADAIDMMRLVIEAETPRLHDLSNETPEKSQELIASSQLRIERLTKAIQQLAPRIDALDREAEVARWHDAAVKLQAESDALRKELRDTYTVLVDQLVEIWTKIDANARAIQNACIRRPSGTHFSLLDADNPRLKNKLCLPSFDNPDRIIFPSDGAWEQQAAISLSLSAAAAGPFGQVGPFNPNMTMEECQAECDRANAEREQQIAERKAYDDARYAAEAKARDLASRKSLYKTQRR